jgi:hypothetical protein
VDVVAVAFVLRRLSRENPTVPADFLRRDSTDAELAPPRLGASVGTEAVDDDVT